MDFGGRTERGNPSRDRRVSHPLSIGTRMMVRVSEWALRRQFGWYRRSNGFCPMCGAEVFFIFQTSPAVRKPAGHLPPKVKNKEEIP